MQWILEVRVLSRVSQSHLMQMHCTYTPARQTDCTCLVCLRTSSPSLPVRLKCLISEPQTLTSLPSPRPPGQAPVSRPNAAAAAAIARA